MKKKRVAGSIIGICVLALVVWGVGLAQPKKFGGGDIKYELKGADPVLFSHETHVNQYKLKCTDCHTKIFKMKKEDLKMIKEPHAKDQRCGACHDGKKEFGGKKTFSMSSEAHCGKCHKRM